MAGNIGILLVQICLWKANDTINKGDIWKLNTFYFSPMAPVVPIVQKPWESCGDKSFITENLLLLLSSQPNDNVMPKGFQPVTFDKITDGRIGTNTVFYPKCS